MELVILIGLQASGKSTFARSRFGTSHMYISMDALGNNRHPARRQLELVEAALQQGHSVVVDNTNATVEVRKPLIELGCQYEAEVNGYYFAPQLKQCLQRNRARTGKARVPDIALFATLKKLARPSYAEGFSKLFYVQTTEEQGFEVDTWQEEEDAVQGTTKEE